MAKEYFLAYFDYLDSIGELSDAEVGRLFKAALKYGQSGIAPKLCGNEKFAFGFIKKQIDRDNEKYEQKCETNRRNGALGGKTKTERQVLANGSERFSNVAFAPKEKTKEKENTKTNIKESIAKAIPKKKFGEFKNVLLTEAEYERLKTDYDEELPGIIEYFGGYIEMKGYKAKSHNLAIRNWVVTAYREKKQREINLENRQKEGMKNAVNSGNSKSKPEFKEYPEYDTYGTDDPEGLAEEIRRIKEQCAKE